MKHKILLQLFHPIWGFPISRGTLLGVPIIRILVVWSIFWVPPILGNYHIILDRHVVNCTCSTKAWISSHPQYLRRFEGELSSSLESAHLVHQGAAAPALFLHHLFCQRQRRSSMSQCCAAAGSYARGTASLNGGSSQTRLRLDLCEAVDA